MTFPIAQDKRDGVVLAIYVQPKTSRTECAGMFGRAIKLRVAAHPVDGKANEEVVGFLANQLSVSRADVRIQSGMTARYKRVFVKGLTAKEACERLRLPV